MNMKRISMRLLVIVLSFLIVVIPVSANEPITSVSSETASNSSILYSVTGASVSPNLKSVILKNDISLTSSSQVQVSSVSSKTSTGEAISLTVTNAVGDTITKDVLLFVNAANSNYDISEIGHSITIDYPPDSWDGRYVIHGTATYNRYTILGHPYYYYPRAVSFSYTLYEDCDVEKITVAYDTYGDQFTFPGFEYIKGDEEYVITLTKSNPVESVKYQKTDPYTSGRVIRISGSPLASCYLTFVSVVDGDETSYSVHF